MRVKENVELLMDINGNIIVNLLYIKTITAIIFLTNLMHCGAGGIGSSPFFPTSGEVA